MEFADLVYALNEIWLWVSASAVLAYSTSLTRPRLLAADLYGLIGG